MSVFGGDSWGREAQNRKRRVDDLVTEGLEIDGSSYKKLSNGKFTCFVCPHHPILDSPLMLSMHCKGSRHRASEFKIKEKELKREDEMKKRIALSDCSVGSAKTSKISSPPYYKSGGKPLIEQTRKSALEIVGKRTAQLHKDSEKPEINLIRDQFMSEPANSYKIKSAGAIVSLQLSDFQEHRERELKFTSAGWKRDGYGRWYKDENVEFDSDEEDPNTCLT